MMQTDLLDTTATDIVEVAAANPVVIFTDEAKFSEFYQKLKAETDKHVPDVSTAKGRGEIASEAFRVTKAKTTLDKAGKALTEKWRADTAKVNDARKKMVTELDALADEVRRPLTDWEEAEKARLAAIAAAIGLFRQAEIVQDHDTSATVETRGRELFEVVLDPATFGDRLDEATTAKDAAVASLHRARDLLAKKEADAAELETLRAEAAARVERERAEAEQRARDEAARLAQERQERQAREAEQRRQADIAAAADRAAQTARDEEVRKAREAEQARDRQRQAEAEEQRRQHEEQIAEERRQREAIELQARQEREQREQAERERAAEAQRVADARAKQEAEDRAREASRTHRAKVKRAAKEAIMTCGASEDAAQKIVLAIIAGEVPAVTLRF